MSCWSIIIEKFGPGYQQKWSYWPLSLFDFFSLVIKTLATHLFCSWKSDSSALFMDLLIFQRCKYFASILKNLITHYLLRIHLDVLKNFAKFIGQHLCWREVSFLINCRLEAWEVLAQMFSSEYHEIFKNTFFTEKHQGDCFCIFIWIVVFNRSFSFTLTRFWLRQLASCELKKKRTLFFFLLFFCFYCLHYPWFQCRENSVTQHMTARSALQKQYVKTSLAFEIFETWWPNGGV